MTRKIALRCHLGSGDCVILSAVMRDIHRAYPGEFEIAPDVRGAVRPIFKHNPYLPPTRFTGNAMQSYESIDARFIPYGQYAYEYHKLHYVEYAVKTIADKLELNVPCTAKKGDIHLSEQEKAVRPIKEPYFLVVAGGKMDATVKLYPHYQRVVDLLPDVNFVQIGGRETNWHPPLDGVKNLVGRTEARDLVKLVYHCQGILCPITFPMHLAGALGKPAVVLAGGYEPPGWIQYDDHEIISCVGTLDCCLKVACNRRFAASVPHQWMHAECLDIQRDISGFPVANCMVTTPPERVADSVRKLVERCST